VKIYSVIFNTYTDYSENTISDGVCEIGEDKKPFIYVGYQPFLITEDQIDQIRKYGKGIKELKFVGNLWDPERPFAIDERNS